MSDNSISRSLGLTIIPKEEPISTLVTVEQEDNIQSVSADFEHARKNILDVIQSSSDAISSAAEIAEQSQSPRFYEVLATLMKTHVDANRELLALQKQIRDIKKGTPEPSQNTTVTNNNLFVGTSNDLLRILKKVNGET